MVGGIVGIQADDAESIAFLRGIYFIISGTSHSQTRARYNVICRRGVGVEVRKGLKLAVSDFHRGERLSFRVGSCVLCFMFCLFFFAWM